MGFTKRETILKYRLRPENRLKVVYRSMISRCYDEKNIAYKHYGKRGITVCDEWLQNPQTFYDWSNENGYKYIPRKNGWNTLTIDRIDVNKGYSPENCRWVDMKKQGSNKRDNVYFEYKGESRTLRDWCRVLNLPYPKMYYRVYFKKQTLEQAILGKEFKFVDEKPATNYRYIYKQKDVFVVEIKKKYYGRRKTLEDAIELRNSILAEMGLLEQLKEFELKGEK